MNYYVEAMAALGYEYSTEGYEIDIPGRAGERLLINDIVCHEETTDVAVPVPIYGLQVRGESKIVSATTDGCVIDGYPDGGTTLDAGDCLAIMTNGGDYKFVDVGTATPTAIT